MYAPEYNGAMSTSQTAPNVGTTANPRITMSLTFDITDPDLFRQMAADAIAKDGGGVEVSHDYQRAIELLLHSNPAIYSYNDYGLALITEGGTDHPQMPARTTVGEAPAPEVAATVWIDGLRETSAVTFDAAPTMHTLNQDDVAALRADGWADSIESDDFAVDAADSNAKVADLFTALEILQRGRNSFTGEAPGFTVKIDAAQAEAWIATHRPGWTQQ